MESIHWLSGKVLQSWQLRNLWGGSSGAAGRGKTVIWSIFSEIPRRKFLRTQGNHNTDKNTSNRRNTGQLCCIECSLGSDFYKFLGTRGKGGALWAYRGRRLLCAAIEILTHCNCSTEIQLRSTIRKKGGKESLIIEFFVILQMIVDYRQHLIIKIVRTK